MRRFLVAMPAKNRTCPVDIDACMVQDIIERFLRSSGSRDIRMLLKSLTRNVHIGKLTGSLSAQLHAQRSIHAQHMAVNIYIYIYIYVSRIGAYFLLS